MRFRRQNWLLNKASVALQLDEVTMSQSYLLAVSF